MTAALVGLAIGAVALAAIAVGGCISFAAKSNAATNRAATAEKDQAATSVRLEVAIANLKSETEAKNAEKARGDALDAAIAEEAAKAVGPVRGSWERLLQASRDAAARAAGGRSPAVVPDASAVVATPAADRDDPDGLLRPGE